MEPYLQRHPYANEVQERVMPRPGIVVPILLTPLRQHQIRIPLLTLHIPKSFPVFYRHFNFSQSGGALPPTSPLHQQQILIRLLPLPIPNFFTPLYHHFNIS